MELTINNQTRHFTESTVTIQTMLDIEIPLKQKGIAVAVNNTVIPKTQWNSFTLSSTDQILIISATQGG
ncbi:MULTISPECIES: sulfur carrier protein ThiS [Flavobacterium]|uniref:Sulfur carrier protein ThiS n=1 Tax=Flavobacterium suzhouense TaxID=1529638 RepID=A0ABW5NU91_9FLAO|nr:sulfur carrier protein ThiS [Flavobacterium sp. AG291]RDI10477.1 sulfur carrier protein ThiS [Flavobacterium sp. AG291]